MNPRTIRRVATASLAALTLSAVAGCGSSPTAPALSQPTVTTTTTAPATTSTTASAAASSSILGPLAKVAVIQATDQDGYQATVTVRWHAARNITYGDLYPLCADEAKLALSTGSAEQFNPDRFVFSAVTAEVRATFHASAGMTWPSDRRLGITYTYQVGDLGGPTMCDDQGTGVSSDTGLGLTTTAPTATLMWIRWAEITPNNPSATVAPQPTLTYVVNPEVGMTGTCTQTGSDSGDTGCITRYAP